jgi:4-hydroxybenzoate polyprenyltransferase
MSMVMKLPFPRNSKVNAYVRLMRIDRPIGALLLMWPTLWALWIAGAGRPSPGIVIIFVVGVFMMRSAGCVINDYADRDIDAHVKRTRDRPLAAGLISRKEALQLFVLLLSVAFLLVLLLNTLTLVLAFVGAGLAALYPFMKRHTYLPQVYLGLAFSWSIPMAFAALTENVPALAWLLFIANLLWVVVYDTIYAMVDRDDDIRIGVKSTAILFGDADRIIIGITQLLMLVALAVVASKAELGMPFYASLAIAAGLMIYHQYLIFSRRRDECFRAFVHNNWIGAAVFAGIFLDYALSGSGMVN